MAETDQVNEAGNDTVPMTVVYTINSLKAIALAMTLQAYKFKK